MKSIKTMQTLFLLAMIIISFAVSEDVVTKICAMTFDVKGYYTDCLKRYLSSEKWKKVRELAECFKFFYRDDFLIGYLCENTGRAVKDYPLDKQRCVKKLDEKTRSYIFNEHCYKEIHHETSSASLLTITGRAVFLLIASLTYMIKYL